MFFPLLSQWQNLKEFGFIYLVHLRKFELFWCAAVEEDSSIVRTILADFKACFVLHVVVSGCTENPNGFVTPSSGSPF